MRGLITCRWENQPGTTRKRAIWCEAINTRADVLKALEEIAAPIKSMAAPSYWPAGAQHQARKEEDRLNRLRAFYRGVRDAPKEYLIANVLEIAVEVIGGMEANKLARLRDRARLLWPRPPEEGTKDADSRRDH